MTELFRPSELMAYLEELGTDAKKGLSQNFLIDGNILNKIAKTSNASTGDAILEIGPGPGALTQTLLKTGARVIAVEMDTLFAQGLQKRLSDTSSLTVIEGDFLKLDLSKVLTPHPTKWKVVANLPYQITTPILSKLFSHSHLLSTITVMVQKEVGERMVALPGNPNYSRLSLFTRYYTDPTLCFTVSPNSFYPPPKVSSAVMHLNLKQPPAVSSEEGLFSLIKAAFGQKRKMLRASLCTLFPKVAIEQALESLDLAATTRPQHLSLEMFISLYEALASHES